MKLIFAGTPEFAARALQALLAAGHAVRCPRCRVLRLPAATDTRTSAERLMDDMKSRRR